LKGVIYAGWPAQHGLVGILQNDNLWSTKDFTYWISCHACFTLCDIILTDKNFTIGFSDNPGKNSLLDQPSVHDNDRSGEEYPAK
jgi:hypothetical protein